MKFSKARSIIDRSLAENFNTMNKHIILVLLTLVFSSGTFSQVSKGSMEFNGTIGIFNGDNMIYAIDFWGSAVGLETHKFPVGFSIQGNYFAKENLVMGLEVNYIESGYTKQYQGYSGSPEYVYYPAYHSAHRQKLRVLYRLGGCKVSNRNSKIETRYGITAGVRIVKHTYNTNDPLFNDDRYIEPPFENFEKATKPFTFGAYLGQRYQLTNSIGFMYELRLSTSQFLNMGISYRIR